MAKSTLRLDTRRALKDGTFPVQIVVGLGTNIYLSTGIYAASDEWNARTLQYIGKGNKRINAALTAMLSAVTSRIMELKENGQWQRLTRPQLKQMLTNLDLSAPTVGVPTLSDVFDEMMQGRRDNTKYSVRSVRQHLTAFCGGAETIRFDMITRIWLEDFYRSMGDLSINTKNTYMRILRRAVNWALDHDITTNNPFRNYHIPSEETKMRDLPLDKLRTFIEMPLRKNYKEYRDVFLLTFYLIGINMVDLSGLTAENIVNGRLEYRRAKTNKLYSIKLEPEALEIIERNRGKNHLLSWFDRYESYKVYQGIVNNALGRMGPPETDADGKVKRMGNNFAQMLPLEKSLTLYWARYSWATYAADLDVPKDTISEALGHSHGAKVTGVYIKFNRDKVDAANRAVIDYVLGK